MTNQQNGWQRFGGGNMSRSGVTGSQFAGRGNGAYARNGYARGAYNRGYGYGARGGWDRGGWDRGGWGGGGWSPDWGFGLPWNWLADVPYALQYLNPCLYAPCTAPFTYSYSNPYPYYQSIPGPYGVYNSQDQNAPADYPPDPNQQPQ